MSRQVKTRFIRNFLSGFHKASSEEMRIPALKLATNCVCGGVGRCRKTGSKRGGLDNV